MKGSGLAWDIGRLLLRQGSIRLPVCMSRLHLQLCTQVKNSSTCLFPSQMFNVGGHLTTLKGHLSLVGMVSCKCRGLVEHL